MNVNRNVVIAPVIQCVTVLAGLLLITVTPIAAEQPAAPEGTGQSERDSSRAAALVGAVRVTVSSEWMPWLAAFSAPKILCRCLIGGRSCL
jgi:hypothetical protein